MDIADLINLPGIKVANVSKEKNNEVHITIETTEKSTICRSCGKELKKRHGSDKDRKVRHLPVFGRVAYIIYKPNRYIYHDCDKQPTTTATPIWHKQKSAYTVDNDGTLHFYNSSTEETALPQISSIIHPLSSLIHSIFFFAFLFPSFSGTFFDHTCEPNCNSVALLVIFLIAGALALLSPCYLFLLIHDYLNAPPGDKNHRRKFMVNSSLALNMPAILVDAILLAFIVPELLRANTDRQLSPSPMKN